MYTDDTLKYFHRAREVLRTRKGAAKAITLNDLAMKIGLTKYNPDRHRLEPERREMESLMETCLELFDFPLVAGTNGYFVPGSAGEITRYLESLESRHVKLWRRKKTVVRKALKAGFRRTGKLSFVDPVNTQYEMQLNVQETP